MVDPDGRIVHANAAFGRLVGNPVVATSIDSLFSGEPQPPTMAELAAAEASTWSGEAQIQGQPTGATARIARVRIDRIAGPAGAPAGFTVVLTDLTDRRREDGRLRMFEMAVEQCLEPVLIAEAEPIDKPGPKIVYANRAFSEVTGYALDEVLGKTPRILQGPDTDRGTLDRIHNALARWQPIKAELKNYRKDGTEFWVELAICPVADASGRFTHWVSVQRETTHRRQSEEREREAREVAEQASTAKGLFLANMSHEIRTPVAAMLGYSEILADPRATAAERTESLQSLRRNGGYLLQLVGSVLDLSKIESGKVEPGWIDDSPWRITREVAEIQQLLASEKGVSVTALAAGPLPARCRIEPHLLRQVLLNLAGNAVKFTDPGGSVVLSVEAVPRADDDAFDLRYSVEDDGIGVDESQVARLFEPFEQGDNSMTRQYGGTGLGLNIARRLVELMGGSITAQARPGAGSRFTVTLPCEPTDPISAWSCPGVDPTESGAEVPSEPARPRRQAPQLRGRLLMVDDSPDCRRILHHFLRPTGLEIEQAEDGAEAIECALARPFDIIFLDMQMPRVDGYTAARRMREAGFGGPIIALTAHALPEDRSRCLQAGCTEYLTKPVPLADLYALLSRYLPAANPAAAVAPTGSPIRNSEEQVEPRDQG